MSVGLEQGRQQYHGCEVQHAIEEHQQETDGIVAIEEVTGVEERLSGRHDVGNEHPDGQYGDQDLDANLG